MIVVANNPFEAAHPELPPSPNVQICDCMWDSLSCAVKPSAPLDDINLRLDKNCNNNSTACIGMSTNFVLAEFGAFSMCAPYQRLSWYRNFLQTAVDNPIRCDLDNSDKLLYEKQPAALSPVCSSLLARAGPMGESTIDFWRAAVTSNTVSGSTILPATSTTTTALQTEIPAGELTGGSKRLSSGAISGIVVGFAAVLGILFGIFLLRKRRNRSKLLTQSDGLEVGLPPPGYEHVRNVELDAEARRSELPAPKQTLELAAAFQDSEVTTLENVNNEKKPEEIKSDQDTIAANADIGGEIEDVKDDAGVVALNAEEQLAFASATVHERADEPLSPSWANSEWFDPNDPRQGLTGSPVQGLSGNNPAREVVSDERLTVV